MCNDILITALEDIRDKAKSWEGRVSAPYWNLGDKAKVALERYESALNAAQPVNASDQPGTSAHVWRWCGASDTKRCLKCKVIEPAGG